MSRWNRGISINPISFTISARSRESIRPRIWRAARSFKITWRWQIESDYLIRQGDRANRRSGSAANLERQRDEPEFPDTRARQFFQIQALDDVDAFFD